MNFFVGKKHIKCSTYVKSFVKKMTHVMNCVQKKEWSTDFIFHRVSKTLFFSKLCTYIEHLGIFFEYFQKILNSLTIFLNFCSDRQTGAYNLTASLYCGDWRAAEKSFNLAHQI